MTKKIAFGFAIAWENCSHHREIEVDENATDEEIEEAIIDCIFDDISYWTDDED